VLSERPTALQTLRDTVPTHVEQAVFTALAKLPVDRFASAAEFATALSTNSGATYVANTAMPPRDHARSVRTQRLTMAVLVVTTATAATALWGWLKPAPPTAFTRDRILLGDSVASDWDGAIGRSIGIAPDGSAIVFRQGTGETAQLYLKSRDQISATAIAGTSAVRGAVTFSPDGQWIAFVGQADGKLLKVPRAGGTATVLADSASISFPSAAWTEHGTLLYVHRDNGLRAVSQDGGVPRTILPEENFRRVVRGISALPGGDAALVTLCVPGCVTSALLTVDLRTGASKRLAEQALAGWWLSGGTVAYVGRDGQVYAAPFDMKRLAFARTPVSVLSGVQGTPGGAEMVVSASGTALYVTGDGSRNSVVSAEPMWVTRSGNVTTIDSAWRVSLLPPGAGNIGRTMSLSPDGSQLAIQVLRDGWEHDVWIKQLKQSPDGRTLWYASGGVTRPGFVFRKRTDGTGSTDTVARPTRGINEVLLTPDTNRLIVRAISPPSRDIMQWQRGRDTLMPLMATPTVHEIAPVLSPDAKWLAYSSDESGAFQLYVRPYPDVNSGRWQVSQAGGRQPVWSRNGRELFYVNAAGMLISAAVLPGSTFTLGAQVPLFDTKGFASNVFSVLYDVAPDGQRFVFLRPRATPGGERPAVLVQITNWAAEVRAMLAGKTPR
jgi:serine/threonine-protein kinase